jgi:hypothetical protein
MLVETDRSALSKGLVRIRWKKDAPLKYRLSAKTIEFQPQGGVLQVHQIKDTIKYWVEKLYVEPYANKGYDFDVTVEDFPEE